MQSEDRALYESFRRTTVKESRQQDRKQDYATSFTTHDFLRALCQDSHCEDKYRTEALPRSVHISVWIASILCVSHCPAYNFQSLPLLRAHLYTLMLARDDYIASQPAFSVFSHDFGFPQFGSSGRLLEPIPLGTTIAASCNCSVFLRFQQFGQYLASRFSKPVSDDGPSQRRPWDCTYAWQ